MDRKEDESDKMGKVNYKSLLKGQEILNNTINAIEVEQNKYKIISSNELAILKIKPKGFNSNKINYQIEAKQKLYLKSIKNIYKKYKTILIKSKYLLKRINIFKFKKYYEQKNLSKHSSKALRFIRTQSYFNIINYLKLNLIYFIKKIGKNVDKSSRSLIKNCSIITYFLQNTYLKNTLKLEKSLLIFLSSTKRKYNNSLLFLFTSIKNKNFKNQINTFVNIIRKPLGDILSLDKTKIVESLKRLGFVFYLYFLPFIYLASEALIPYIPEYDYSIVNPLSSQLFEKIPILVELIKLFRPLIIGPNLQLWILIGYFLVFPLGYRSLKLSYKVAYNGTIALIFLMINYSCTLGQDIMRLGFESIKMIKDVLFTSYLIKHLGKTKNKEKEVAFSVFNNLISRYDYQIGEEYYKFRLLVSHRIFSHLALISLAALLYNCLYYVIYNKNPEILLVTKAALGTIKNPQEED